jgi:nucleoside-diphosphate-sugar epimerase
MKAIEGRRITLIGGAGFIGHHLALELKRRGAEVTVVDGLEVNNLLYFTTTANGSAYRRMYLEMINQRLELMREAGIDVLVQDARDYHALSRLLLSQPEKRPQVIVQLAAVAHAGRSNKDPYSTFDHSLRTLENALDCARHGVEHFIYFSSSMVYGHFQGEQVTEETPCDPLGIYGALKFAGEKIVNAYNQVFELPYTIVRPSALYGERCVSRRVGQIFIENALAGKEVVVHGDGSDRLDFTYIDDLVHGLCRVIESEKSLNQTFNLTYGQSRCIADLAEILQKHFPQLTVRYEPKDHLTPDRGTLCVDKARELIGYDPQFPLERGFEKYIRWYRETFSSTERALT